MTTARGLAARFTAERGAGFTLEVELEIAASRTVALLGPNGAGKTSVVAALAGLLPINSGRIELSSRPLDDPACGLFVAPEERRIGVVFQDHVLFPHLSVLQNVAFGLDSRGERGAVARARALEWLERLDLRGLADRRPRELSGGQSQRVALARALITDPELLLLDEPLAALDVSTRARLRRVLVEHLAPFPGPRLLITHDPTEAFLLADEIHVIEGGRIVQTGTAEEIRLRPRTPYVADLAGSNLLTGTAEGGVVSSGDVHLRVADTRISGEVLVTIHPRAIALHLARPEGSPRNSWQTQVTWVEESGDRVRLSVGDPQPLTVEVTPEACQALQIERGTSLWLSIKATEIHVEAA